MTLRYTTRPISDRTWLRPAGERKRSQFDATWTRTLQQLEKEIDHLGGRDVVIEVDVRERDIRVDGMLRAAARAESPAVVVAFDTRNHGPMLYRCDRYLSSWSNRPGWQENIRAIALTLESLRAVDRYGATETGEQYAGFRALPGATTTPPSLTREGAIAFLIAVIPDGEARRSELVPDLPRLFRIARREAHPDRHAGAQGLWDQVEQAGKVLGLL